jgi:hypothetical protein
MLPLLKRFRSDHPLDGKKARLEVLEDTKRLTAIDALRELSTYLNAVNTAENLTPIRALDIVEFVESAAKPLRQSLTMQFLSHPHATKFEQDRLHSVVHSYSAQLVEAYRFCLAKYQVNAVGAGKLTPHLSKVICCALEALTTQVKWALFRRSAFPQGLWQEIIELYQVAIALDVASTICMKDVQAQSTPEHAFLAPLMLTVSAPDALRPSQVELASQIIDRIPNHFRISARPEPFTFYTCDLTGNELPGRVRHDRAYGPNVVYFGPGSAAEKLKGMIIASKHRGSEPTELGCKVEMAAPLVRATLRHLLRHWSIELPKRVAERRRHVEDVTVIHEFEKVLAGVGGLFSMWPFPSSEEHWAMENKSLSGYGAYAPAASGTWLTVGSLVALRRDGGSAWGAGVVRRIANTASEKRYVGVEMLSHGGTGVMITAANHSQEEANQPPGGSLCVLLPSGNVNSGEATLLMHPNSFSDSQDLIMNAYDHRYLLCPLRLLEQGDEFDLGRYRVAKL